ncbi:ubiE/COQ5 methyltransferase [Lineolata rhizophorae]|uniref:Arsenite methyltransferase n=1 Tax=Lineolata rhizophorae TaxID=578093 RepID=A0A6A6P9R2_9PEZI|nr:ubiE/COQ5 methyltransferase [Lineolata rhizophorae]
MSLKTKESTYETIRGVYGSKATAGESTETKSRIAAALGYDPEDAAAIPDQANLGVGCGNPLMIANLREGETVLDLGSGGGFDVLLASKKVGSTGKAIGVDMTEDMLELARRNAAKMNVTNVDFIRANITKIPVESESVDCVISNCVLNLVPQEDKPCTFAEMYRILKPGGRIAVSDFLALKPLPPKLKEDAKLWTECISGALEVGQMDQMLRSAGFQDLLLVDKHLGPSLYQDQTCCSTQEGSSEAGNSCCTSAAGSVDGPARAAESKMDSDLDQYLSAFNIYALKANGA